MKGGLWDITRFQLIKDEEGDPLIVLGGSTGTIAGNISPSKLKEMKERIEELLSASE